MLPLQEKMEEWKKVANTLDKEHSREYKKLRQELKKKTDVHARIAKKQKKSSKGRYVTNCVFIVCEPKSSDRPNTFGKSRTEPSAEIGPIYRTRSAVLAEHSSVGRTIVRQKNSSVRFGRNRVRSITS